MSIFPLYITPSTFRIIPIIHVDTLTVTSVFLALNFVNCEYSKTCLKQSLSQRPNIGIHDQLSLYACQKYCRMLQREHSAILPTFIKLPFVIVIFVLSIFEWPLKTGFTVQ